MAYPLEVYKPGAYRVIWSPEEHAQAKEEGWGDQKDPDQEPRYSAMHEIAEDIKAGTFPKRRGRPPRVQSEVA